MKYIPWPVCPPCSTQRGDQWDNSKLRGARERRQAPHSPLLPAWREDQMERPRTILSHKIFSRDHREKPGIPPLQMLSFSRCQRANYLLKRRGLHSSGLGGRREPGPQLVSVVPGQRSPVNWTTEQGCFHQAKGQIPGSWEEKGLFSLLGLGGPSGVALGCPLQRLRGGFFGENYCTSVPFLCLEITRVIAKSGLRGAGTLEMNPQDQHV